MKIRNYCIVVMGDTKNVLLEIAKIAETKPSVLDAKGILIATFSATGSPPELSTYFKSYNRSFLLFDLSSNNSGFNIIKQEIHDGLFGFLDDKMLRDRTEELLKEINLSSDIKNSESTINPSKEVIKNPKAKKITENDVDNMSLHEKRELFDKLFNNIENLSDYDKKILEKLAI